MLTNTYYILLYTLGALGIYYLVPERFRKGELVCAGALFYLLCDYRYFLLLFAEIGISFYVGARIHTAVTDGRKRSAKRWLSVGIICVLSVLGFFKYYGFFVDKFSLSSVSVALPLGISYYSFKILSYLIDIYTGKRKKETSFVGYSVYIAFFPHLLSGPIVRSEGMLEQLSSGLRYDSELFSQGCILIISGLFKKAVIADRLGDYVNQVFSRPSSYPALALWMGAVFYTVQLYCDFAGYSEIAVGSTRLFGIKCESNFVRPYLAQNMQDFWRRWHVSLSSWLRDYIYIPLGGNRVGRWRKVRNVMLTFLACGIWHGGQWHYLLWGTYHGICNVVTRRKNKSAGIVRRAANRFCTMMLVLFGWIFFRADSVGRALEYIKLMFLHLSFSYNDIIASILIFTQDNTSISYCILIFLMVLLMFVKELLEENNKKGKDSLLWTGIFLFCILMYGYTGASSFLYANY